MNTLNNVVCYFKCKSQYCFINIYTYCLFQKLLGQLIIYINYYSIKVVLIILILIQIDFTLSNMHDQYQEEHELTINKDGENDKKSSKSRQFVRLPNFPDSPDFSQLKLTLKRYLRRDDLQNNQQTNRYDKQSQKISLLNLQLKTANKQIDSLKTQFHSQQQKNHRAMKQYQQKQRKQLSKYMQVLTQKQNKIESLNTLVTNQNTKIQQLNNEINSMSQKEHIYEQTLVKSMQSLKGSIRQLNTSLEQTQVDKIVLQEKLTKIQTRIKQTYSQLYTSEQNRRNLEQKYHRLKVKNIELKQQNMQLKFSIEDYKLKIQQRQRNQNRYYDQHKNTKNEYNLFSKLQTIASEAVSINSLFNTTVSLQQSISQTQQIIEKMNYYIKQNSQLKRQLAEKQKQINRLEMTINGQYFDEILKNRKPSIYEQLVQKKQNLCKYQNKINQILQSIQNKTTCLPEKYNPQVFQIGVQVDWQTKSKGVGSEPVSTQSKQQLSQSIKKQPQLTKQREKYLLIKLDEINYEKNRIQKLNKLYRKQLLEMIETYEKNKGKRTGKGAGTKIKKKNRCQVCLFELTIQKPLKCEECHTKMHKQCRGNHQCKGFNDNMSCCSSQADF